MTQLREKQLEIINYYGAEEQLDRLIEECSELIQAICKWRRYEFDDTSIDLLLDLIEELADVKNLIEQLELDSEFVQEGIQSIMNYKVNRELNRISQELQDSGQEDLSKKIDCKYDL